MEDFDDEIEVDEIEEVDEIDEVNPDEQLEEPEQDQDQVDESDAESEDEAIDPVAQHRTNIQTLPIVTKFEKANLIGRRALMLSKGMPSLIECDHLKDPIDIATEEYKRGKLPLLIRRKIPL